MRTFWLYVLLLCVIGLASGCATLAKFGVIDSQQDRYTYWTRYYETRMGLVPAKIVFDDDLDWCGYVDSTVTIGARGPEPDEEIVSYNLTANCEEPWKVVKHEMCHRRLQHLYMRFDTDPVRDYARKEDEVEDCVAWWYR